MTGEPDMHGEDRDLLAAEYAMGLLDGAARAEAESLAARDPAFAREIGRWSGRLAPLLDEVAPRPAPADAWRKIERRIANAPASGPAFAPAFGQASNVVALRRTVGRWRAVSAAATALAASLALVLVTRPVPHPPAAPPAAATLVAVMDASGSPAKLVATYEPARRSLVVAAAAGLDPVPGRGHELWLIPAGGTPRPMGMVTRGAPVRIAVPAAMLAVLRVDSTLAVSVEPSGGSPTGLPTGPVIAAGKLVQT